LNALPCIGSQVVLHCSFLSQCVTTTRGWMD
jgi:hypothetical protein